MPRKLHTLSTVTAVLAGLAVTQGWAAPKAASASPELMSQMQHDFGLTEAQVQRRLTFEAAAPHIESTLKAELGNRFGGAWLNKDGTQLIVGVTHEADADLVRSAGAEPQRVSRSLEQLEQVKAALDRNAQSASKSIHAWYIDVTTNSIVVLAENSGMAKQQVDSFVALAEDKDSTIQVVPSEDAPRPFYDVRGADPFYTQTGGRCLIGFSVVGGFITAGHCGTVGTTTKGYNMVDQGVFQGSSFPGNDYAWVKVNSNWTPRGVINNSSGGTIAVTGSTVAPVGASVCRPSPSTGWRCGTIQSRNATINYAEGVVTGLTRTNVCAGIGDSGGPWLSGTQAQGVTSGGSGNCTSGGTTYFQPVNEILNAYGLTLVVGG
ncbi:S1 family peptidase [Archangium violaceum]|uniref:S1 family peptidase n=1 Tax=Archangium violaceum TaxID=83451 RepID=UPI002B293B1B|nr:S1 family peptidase [Archangium violaceum]